MNELELTNDEIRRAVSRCSTQDGVLREGPRAVLQAEYGALALEQDRKAGAL